MLQKRKKKMSSSCLLSGKPIFQKTMIFCLNVKNINHLRSLSNSSQWELWLPSTSMCLNGQKLPSNVKLTVISLRFMWALRKPIWGSRSLGCYTMTHCFISHVSVSMQLLQFHLSANVCLLGFLLLIMGNRFSWNILGTLFNSCPDTSRQDINDSFNVCRKPETELKYIVASRSLQLLISPTHTKPHTEITRNESQQAPSLSRDPKITELGALFIRHDTELTDHSMNSELRPQKRFKNQLNW